MIRSGRSTPGAMIRRAGGNTLVAVLLAAPAVAQAHRMGVCYTFTLQCLAHGGGGCDSCGRQWGNLFCKETLKKTVKDTVPKAEGVFGEDSEWPELISPAEEVAGSTLVDDLNGFRQDVLNGAVDGPVDELCDGYFYPAA
ncbi:MAG: hypothetical protein WD273_03105 [Trueperaceae bacterium]